MGKNACAHSRVCRGALISGQAARAGVNLLGLFYAVLSAFSYCAMVLFNRMAKQVKGIENTMLQLLCALAAIAIFVGCKQGFYMDIAAPCWAPILWIDDKYRVKLLSVFFAHWGAARTNRSNLRLSGTAFRCSFIRCRFA